MPIVHLKTKRLEYKFSIEQKYNLLVGDSGCGKTTLVDMVFAYEADKSAVQCLKYDKIKTDRKMSISDFSAVEGYVILLDEDSRLLHQGNAASILEQSNNYFVIICREINLGFKSISLDAIFNMKSSGRYHTFERKYKTFDGLFCINQIICEDSGSGLQFLQTVFSQNDVSVDYAKAGDSDKTGGKEKFVASINRLKKTDSVCLVFDRSAIGYEFEKILTALRKQKIKYCFIDWDSFECYILQSKVFNTVVPEPGYEYESKENLATKMLQELVQYGKTHLCKCLTQNGCKICSETLCKYRHFDHTKLIYWKVEDLLNCFNNKIESESPKRIDKF